MVNYHANPITSGMFITATAPNPLVVDLVNKATGGDIQLSWTTCSGDVCTWHAMSACDAVSHLYNLSP